MVIDVDNVLVNQRDDGSLAIVPFQVDGVDSGENGELDTRQTILVIQQITAAGHDVHLETDRCWGDFPAGDHSVDDIQSMMKFKVVADNDWWS